MRRLVLGLDIGITSIGWAIIDLIDGKVVDCGVRIFNEGAPKNNVNRRKSRSLRRNVSRRSTRRNDAKKLLKDMNVVFDNTISESPYELRTKGLKERLTDGEFFIAYMHLVKRRGSSFEPVDSDENESELKAILSGHDAQIASGKFPCEIQLERLKDGKPVRGLQNNFRTAHYKKEIEQILKNQRFNQEEQSRLIELITRRRRFDEGPGSLKSPSDYGRFILQPDGTIEVINLIEKMTGSCSLYPEELRAPKMCPSSELFNLLNDLNNISLIDNGRKLSESEKSTILNEHIFSKNHSITPTQLGKALNINLNTLKGFREDKKKKPLLTKPESLRAFLQIIRGDVNIWDVIDDLDQISVILTRNKNVEDRRKEIKDLKLKYLTDMEIEEIVNLTKFTGYHSLSLKAMREFREQMIQSSLNFAQLVAEKKRSQESDENLEKSNKIIFDGSKIYSPVARKSIHQAIKIVNKARTQFGEFDAIVIEMPRDRNSDEQKERIKDFQKYREGQGKKIAHLVADKKINGKLRSKLLLYLEQECKCLYTGDTIDLERLINDPNAYEIDHIIPISVSFDDSNNNKALVTALANQEKGKRTVAEAFRQFRFSCGTYGAFHNNVMELYKARKITSKKLENLLFDEPLDSIDTLKRFVNRNLVDTQYSSRVVLNTLQQYFKVNDIETSVLTVRGAITNQFRRRIKLSKDRDENFNHHAIDAAIIAFLADKKTFYQVLKHSQIKEDHIDLDETVEIGSADDEYFESNVMRRISSLKEIEHVKVSHMVDRKPNRQISDDTICSTRIVDGKEFVVRKCSDIYSDKAIKIAKRFQDNDNLHMFLMYQHDPKTFAFLQNIVSDYLLDNDKIDKENPFSRYRDNFGPIRKVSKNGNGPIITSLKYRENVLGHYIDISDNYESNVVESKRRRVVLLSISPYRTDMYQREDGSISFVTVHYKDIFFDSVIQRFRIDEAFYEEKLHDKKLWKATFLHSFNRGDLIKITSLNNSAIREEMYRFIGTNNDSMNRIEVKPIDQNGSKRIKPTIGKKTIKIEKYATDVLGNVFKIDRSVLKLVI